jgi:hypothetical protein
MYHELFVCIMYDSHDFELYIMYDSHDVYLYVLLTICMYKFSRWHAIIFHDFFFHLPIFGKIRPKIAKIGDLSVKSDD